MLTKARTRFRIHHVCKLMWEVKMAIRWLLLLLSIAALSLTATGQADVSSELEDLSEKVEDLGAKIDNAAREVENVGEEVENVGDEVDDLEDELEDVGDDIEDEIDDLEQEVGNVGGNVNNLETVVTALLGKVQVLETTLQTELEKMRNEVSALRGGAPGGTDVAITQEVADLKTTILQALQQVSGKLTDTASEASVKRAALQKQFQNTTDQLQDLICFKADSIDNKIQELTTNQESMRNQMELFQRQVNTSLKSLGERVIEIGQQGSRETQEMTAVLEKKIHQLNTKVTDAASEGSAERTALQENVAELGYKSYQLKNLTRSRIEMVKDKLCDLENREESLTQNIASLNSSIEELEKQIRATCDKVDSISVLEQEHQASTAEQLKNVSREVRGILPKLASVCTSDNTTLNAIVRHQNFPSSCDQIPNLGHGNPYGFYIIVNPTGELRSAFCSKNSQQSPYATCNTLLESWDIMAAPSGNYWVTDSNGSAVKVYCDMNSRCCGSTGGWMRVAYLNMTDPSQQCPDGFRLRTDPKRVCESDTTGGGCVSMTFPTHDVQYSKVCGQARAYQVEGPDAFEEYYNGNQPTIDDQYVYGVSITHGSSPRKHIWTFAAAEDELQSNSDYEVCPCTDTTSTYTGRVPPFIGTDYFCDTGSHEKWARRVFFADDPLWDGEGCGPTSSCCQFNTPPWFCKELPQPTTDDIEVRVCSANNSEYPPIELIELYVQ